MGLSSNFSLIYKVVMTLFDMVGNSVTMYQFGINLVGKRVSFSNRVAKNRHDIREHYCDAARGTKQSHGRIDKSRWDYLEYREGSGLRSGNKPS